MFFTPKIPKRVKTSHFCRVSVILKRRDDSGKEVRIQHSPCSCFQNLSQTPYLLIDGGIHSRMVQHLKGQIGNYRLISQLGSGGFANVYLGEHIHLGTKAAIKILTTTLTYDQLEQFRTEARTIASLSHPNIIRVLDFGIHNNIPFLIMQYAPLGSLRQHHPRGAVLPLDTILRYVKQMAAALHYAHDQKLVHCDVKPENMLLGPQQEVLLSDFGIAIVAQTNRQAKPEQISGTVAYMAPEQLRGHPEFASDQYALGIITYEWLCGTPPFTGRYIEVAIQHERSLPPPLHDRIPISPAVEAVIMTSLEKDPRQRFASITAFANALERAIQLTSSRSAPASHSTQFALSLQAGLLSQSTHAIRQTAFSAPTSENTPQGKQSLRSGPSRRTVITVRREGPDLSDCFPCGVFSLVGAEKAVWCIACVD
jgi:serine/threonine protein kinase